MSEETCKPFHGFTVVGHLPIVRDGSIDPDAIVVMVDRGVLGDGRDYDRYVTGTAHSLNDPERFNGHYFTSVYRAVCDLAERAGLPAEPGPVRYADTL